ncbi:MAG TPA: sigma-54 dependent transcriptional regulator [Vicinamibacterales bacterium]|nr:sigma-54 dependent transcriptional regulator [Vicinamibacterales bacterium]
MARILVVDDETHLRDVIGLVLTSYGFTVHAVGSGEEALEAFTQDPPEVVILDVLLPGISGFEVFRRLREIDAQCVCVFITAHGSVPAAVEAMRAGAFDYITKPFDNDDLRLKITRAVEHRELTRRVTDLESDVSARAGFVGIVGQGRAIDEVLRRLAKVGRSDATVLLTGESGTGKELAAKRLHRTSPRSREAFVPVNCGTIPTTLAEAALFGHERGAFTDAKQRHRGYFEQAHKGTLFLDEVGDLPLDVQVKLLRTVQEGDVLRVGAEQPLKVDVRLIAATNKDLRAEVAAGRFREDLFWRLNVFPVAMPALRDRTEDLPLLIDHLLERVNAEFHTRIGGVTDDVFQVFAEHRWPGNVRELMNVLRHGAIMTEGDVIDLEHLPEYVTAFSPREEMSGAAGATGDGQTLDETMAATEHRLVEAALERARGNQSAAAAALGIDRRTLHQKIRRHRNREQSAK